MRLSPFNFLGAISAILCCLTTIGWAWSYYFRDSFHARYTSADVWLETDSGVIALTRESGSTPLTPQSIEHAEVYATGDLGFVDRESLLYRLGFQWVDASSSTSRIKVVALPYWLLALCFAGVPITRVLAIQTTRLRRRRRGACQSCGFDLRASSQRCPECGTAFRRRGPPAYYHGLPWPFPALPSAEAVSTNNVAIDRQPILLVFHGHDGQWQMLCGKTNRASDICFIRLGKLFIQDHSIGEVADLPLGWIARRDCFGSTWHREPATTNSSELNL